MNPKLECRVGLFHLARLPARAKHVPHPIDALVRWLAPSLSRRPQLGGLAAIATIDFRGLRSGPCTAKGAAQVPTNRGKDAEDDALTLEEKNERSRWNSPGGMDVNKRVKDAEEVVVLDVIIVRARLSSRERRSSSS